jgi:5-oxoprolinase (ATP-hydrolysing) subunit A
MSETTGNLRSIDLNADLGEVPEALADGREEALLRLVTSANVACGGHAGDPATMAGVLALARRLGVSAGAHPGYPDRAGFGRDSLGLTPGEIELTVFEQVSELATVAERTGARLAHVKPHGALYNDAARDEAVAAAIARGVRRWSRATALVGLAGSPALRVFEAEGMHAVAECFADRVYEADGMLRPRKLPGSLITDPRRAADQAVSIAVNGVATAHGGQQVSILAETICVHGDGPTARLVAAAVRAALEAAGVAVRRFRS